jgi:hypothetical protein
LRRGAEKKQALAKRYEMPSHETLLQQYARRRAWAQQRSDDKQAVLHWSTRALLKTVKSYDEMRPEVIRSLQSPQPKRKSDKALGDFALQWLRGAGGFGWAQSRVVMMLQSLYRFSLLSSSFFALTSRVNLPQPSSSRSVPPPGPTSHAVSWHTSRAKNKASPARA